MQKGNQKSEQQSWSEKSLILMRELLHLVEPIATYEQWTTEEQRTLGMLLVAAARSSESTLLLTAYGQLWDAELTLRSVSEASLKFCYLLQNDENYKKRHLEYSNDQFWCGLLKDERKIRILLNALGDPSGPAWKPFTDRLFTDSEKLEIQSRFDKNQQKSVEGRWGFTGIIRELQKSGDPLLKYLVGASHGYSIASHIQHADYQGVAISMERDERSPAQRDSAHSAHLTKVISNTFSYFLIRLIAGYRFIGFPSDGIDNAQTRIRELIESFGTPYENWIEIEYPTS
ncbi:DUF5677 domain-containing protein [Pseudomonas viridiflava]|uniref:DUF5677 domain-containing protein n=1 Tax=Pseudomonas viridiflava TaxID=33069 RepID=UPI0013D6799C|nr:DUF5677 domain-containing protein [Pseudomonas viridiflava]